MAIYLNDVSRTFGEYLLIPGLFIYESHVYMKCSKYASRNIYSYGFVINVDLKRRKICKSGEKSAIELNIPFVSAIMQSVSGPKLAIELARNGGLHIRLALDRLRAEDEGKSSVASQLDCQFRAGNRLHDRGNESQADMVRKVKKFKAGFVISDSNLTPENTLADVLELVRRPDNLVRLFQGHA